MYQTQWRKSEFSVNDIQEHLSKVSKRSWVLNECVSRVPDSLEATRELLNFGLNGANLETLVAIGIDDNGKFTPSDMTDDVEFHENRSELKQVFISKFLLYILYVISTVLVLKMLHFSICRYK